MEARIKNMQAILNDAWGPMVALGKCLATSPVPEKTRELVHMRTAQINGGGARVARVRGRGGQPLQPPQRGDATGRRRAALMMRRLPCKLT